MAWNPNTLIGGGGGSSGPSKLEKKALQGQKATQGANWQPYVPNWWDKIGKDGPDDITKKRIGEIYRLFSGAEGQSSLGYAKAAATNAKQIPLINKSFDTAQANAMKLAENTKRNIMSNEPGRMGAASMELGDRGMDNSNLMRFASRGVRGDTVRALQSLDDFFTTNSNRMETQRAGALGSVYSQNAGYDAAGGSEGAQLKMALAQMIGQFQQAPKKPSDLQQGIGLAADALPLLALL